MDELIEAKKRFFRDYVSEDGLGLLKKGEDHDPHPPSKLRTAGNDNGILFLAYALTLCDHHHLLDDLDRAHVDFALSQIEKEPGLFERHPNAPLKDRVEGLDNYVGVVATSYLFQLKYHGNVLSYGQNHGFNYNDKYPGKWTLRTQRQPSDACFYKFASGVTPTPLEFLWLIGGIILQSFFNVSHTSEHLMTWLRIRTIEHSFKYNLFNDTMKNLFKIASSFYKRRLKKATNGLGIEMLINVYFQEKEHPLHTLAKGVVF